jgi:AcrR family transcriptional regulator
MKAHTTPDALARGPTDHEVRTQIVEAATEYFTRYGYEKTTESDLAKAIGFSKAYVYKFFDSKQAIGEVICANRLQLVRLSVNEAVAGASSASDRLRRAFKAFVEAGSQLFFDDRKLHDIAAVAAQGRWPSVQNYELYVRELIVTILKEGRAAGEFERKTPLDELADAVCLVMKPYISPMLLQHNLEQGEQSALLLSSLLLRSLAP